jgi:hypothetical protein
MFRRHRKNQDYAASTTSSKTREDDRAIAANLRDLGLVGSRSSKSSSRRPRTGTDPNSYSEVPTYPEKGASEAWKSHGNHFGFLGWLEFEPVNAISTQLSHVLLTWPHRTFDHRQISSRAGLSFFRWLSEIRY